MTEGHLLELLSAVQAGKMKIDEAISHLKNGPFLSSDLGFANLDHHRSLRQGLAEVVYGESKTLPQILEIAQKLAIRGEPVLLTRLDIEKRAALMKAFSSARENTDARTVLIHPKKVKEVETGEPFVAVLAAGTSDLPVAEEAAEVCVAMNVAHRKIYDVGVAGLHRLLSRLPDFADASALVVVAGMEGALVSVVGGLARQPVFAVPTSVGYGSNLGGLTTLLAMLNSCAAGVTVSNIDNGFAAGFAACKVVKQIEVYRK